MVCCIAMWRLGWCLGKGDNNIMLMCEMCIILCGQMGLRESNVFIKILYADMRTLSSIRFYSYCTLLPLFHYA